MTPIQYRSTIASLGLSQAGAARLLGVDARTSRRWAQSGAPEPVARFLRFLLAAKVAPDEVYRVLGASK